MHILAVGETESYLEALRVRLVSMCFQLEMVSVDNCWAALSQLKRADVHWDLVILFYPTIALVDVNDLIEPLDPGVLSFITIVPPMEGGYHVVECMNDLGIKPRLGVLCGHSLMDGEGAVRRIEAAGAVAIEYRELFEACVQRVRGA